MKLRSMMKLLSWAGLALLCSRELPAQSLDLSVGNVRGALRKQRAAVAEDPRDPGAYIALAYTLSDAGMNDLAVQTMRKAIEVAPGSALAYDAQGWILRHNVVGEDFGRGLDYDGALAAYRKAIELDPKDMAIREGLANLLERNRDGVEYGGGSKLSAAVDIYRYVKAHQQPVPVDLRENLAIALFYEGLYQEAAAEAVIAPEKTPPSAKLQGVQVAAVAALQSTSAAIAVAAKLVTPEQKAALTLAAEALWNMRLYQQAADLLSASLPNPESKGIAAKIQLFRQLKPYQREEFPEGDPRRPVQRLLVGAVLETLTEADLSECMSRSMLRPGQSWKNSIEELSAITGLLRNLSKKTGLPRAVVEDLVLGNLSIRTVDSREPGARVVVSFAGQTQVHFFVLKEDGVLKVAGDGHDLPSLGTEALHLLRTGRELEATALLNWRRESLQRDQGNDPLSGVLFARVWTPGESSGRASIELAAAAVSQDRAELMSLLPAVQAADASEAPEFVHNTDELVLARVYAESGDIANGLKVAQRLLVRYPGSATAASLTGRAYQLDGNVTAWRALVAKGVAEHPGDKAFLLGSVREAEAEGDFGRALQLSRKILDSESVGIEDEARYARLSVFAGQAGEEALQAAQRSVLGSKSENADYLTTAAWVNASLGNTAEARELLLDAMEAAHIDEPNDGVWYGFGRIDEQYGVKEAALAAYQRVAKKNDAADSPGAYWLAQARIKGLQ